MTDVFFFFSGLAPLIRIVAVGVPMYVALVVFLRLSGSRTLSTMNVFDFIITVAIGSAFGRALTASRVALAEAVVAFLLLIALQYVVAWIQTRFLNFKRLITNPPSLLYFRDEFLRDEMRNQRITEEELWAAVRKQNVGTMDEVEAIVLESSGEVSVITSMGDGSALSELTSVRPDVAVGDDG